MRSSKPERLLSSFLLLQHWNMCHSGTAVVAFSSGGIVGRKNAEILIPQAVKVKGGALLQSDRILHVGNLDWTVPVDDASDAIANAVRVGASKSSSYVISFREVPVPVRERDLGKFHGGSARMTFEGTEQAEEAMESLRKYSDPRGVDQGWRVRWATIKMKEPAAADGDEKEVSAERIRLRRSRAESYARRRQRIAQKTDEAIRKSSAALNLDANGNIHDHPVLGSGSHINHINVPVLHANRLDWSQCPEEIDPVRGGGILKGTERGDRKQAAAEAFILVVQAALLDDDIGDDIPDDIGIGLHGTGKFVADLGCGAGNLSLPLAWWLQKGKRGFGVGVRVLGVDINGHALGRLVKRADRAGIAIETLEEDLLALLPSDDVDRGDDDGGPAENDKLAGCAAVVSLHACGAASDMAMCAAVACGAPFAISPCCIGGVNKSRPPSRRSPGTGGMPRLSSDERSAAPPQIAYPRSGWLRGAVGPDEYRMLAAAADYGVGGASEGDGGADEREIDRRHRGRLAKQIVETDRLQWAKEKGYYVRMVEMPRIGPLYPKRELLLGAKKGSGAALRISNLETS